MNACPTNTSARAASAPVVRPIRFIEQGNVFIMLGRGGDQVPAGDLAWHT